MSRYLWVVERVWHGYNQVDVWSEHGKSDSAARGAAEDRNIENRHNKDRWYFRAAKYVPAADYED